MIKIISLEIKTKIPELPRISFISKEATFCDRIAAPLTLWKTCGCAQLIVLLMMHFLAGDQVPCLTLRVLRIRSEWIDEM